MSLSRHVPWTAFCNHRYQPVEQSALIQAAFQFVNGGAPRGERVDSKKTSHSTSPKLSGVSAAQVWFNLLPERMGNAASSAAGNPSPRWVGMNAAPPALASRVSSVPGSGGAICRDTDIA